MSGVAKALDMPGLAAVLCDQEPTQAEKRREAALKPWKTCRANVTEAPQEDAATLPEPVWSDEHEDTTDEFVLQATEMLNMLRWLSSWSGVNGPLGHMAGSAFESLTGMLRYFDAGGTADPGGAA
jgi:hypothetical protein